MRLPIISFAVFAVCFGLFGCTNGDEVSSMQPSSSEKQNESTNFLLLVTESSKIFTSQYSPKDVNLSRYQIEDHEERFDNYQFVRDFTSTCTDNTYILKYNDPFAKKQVLDVIRYTKNNKFERIDQVKNMFNNARLIASDYKTGKIYWIDRLGLASYNFSIKVTEESSNKSEYIIHPTSEIQMEKLQAYPKRSELFFSSRKRFWYTSNSTNSTPNLVFSSDVTFQNILDFTIDYLTDKLCWIDHFDDESHLYCVDIGTDNRPLNATEFVTIEKIPNYIHDLVAFNNTFYWTVDEDNTDKLYFKNGNETAVEKADLREHFFSSIAPSICSFAQKNGSKNNEVPHSSTEIDIPQQNHEQPASNNQSNSTNGLLLISSLRSSTSSSNILTVKHSTKDVDVSEYEIKNESVLLKKYKLVRDYTFSCLEKNIYILKYVSPNRFRFNKQILEIVHYNKTDKFQSIDYIKDMFDNADSIATDYITGKIFWIEHVYGSQIYSIKVTDESFNKSEYIIHPTNKRMKRLLACQNHNKLFFLRDNRLWYTSDTPNGTERSLLQSYENIRSFTIDYLTDQLCWIPSIGDDDLYCAGIHTSNDTLDLINIVTIKTVPNSVSDFGAFNNTFYWITEEDKMLKLYFKNGNETAVKIADLQNEPSFYGPSIVPSICPTSITEVTRQIG